MPTSVTLQAVESRYIRNDFPDTTYSGSRSVVNSINDRSFIKLDDVPAEYRYKAVSGILLHVYVINNSNSIQLTTVAGDAEYNPDVTYNTRPPLTMILSSGDVYAQGWVILRTLYDSTSYYQQKYAEMVRNGIGINIYSTTAPLLNNSGIDLVGSSNVPYADVYFADTDAYLSISSVSPSTNAYVPKYSANTFSWGVEQNGTSIYDVEVVSSKLRWKTSSDGAVYEIDCGTDLSYTFPANLFSTDSVYWQASVTDSTGHISDSPWQIVTTKELYPRQAVAISPKNIMVDGSKPILFTWQHIISTGTAQTAAQIQKSTNGTTWVDFLTYTGSDQSKEIPANTFTSGQNYWRVRTANTDGNYGEWSEPASFLCVSSPPMPNVSTDGKARPTVTWQSSDQQGFRVKIGDVYDSGVIYGNATSFVVPMYFSDGSYVASVSIINGYGLWSEEGTAPLNVVSTSLGSVVLTGTNGINAQLNWTATSYEDNKFIVYRDGKQIAVTDSTNYTDTETAGTHSYMVRQYRPSDYNATSLSNTVNVTTHVDALMLLDIETGEQMQLLYSSMQYRDEMETKSMDLTMFHFTGAEYPIPEKSSFENKIISFRTAFMNLQDAETFERFYKKTVCVKTPKDNAVIGVFSGYTKTESRFFVGYDFSIQQIHIDRTVIP